MINQNDYLAFVSSCFMRRIFSSISSFVSSSVHCFSFWNSISNLQAKKHTSVRFQISHCTLTCMRTRNCHMEETRGTHRPVHQRFRQSLDTITFHGFCDLLFVFCRHCDEDDAISGTINVDYTNQIWKASKTNGHSQTFGSLGYGSRSLDILFMCTSSFGGGF